MKYFHSTLWFTTLFCGVVLIALVIKLMNSAYWELAISSIITILCAIVIYVQQNKYTERESKKEEKKQNYNKTAEYLNRIYIVLNIRRKFEAFIYNLDPNKDVRPIINEIVKLQDDIDGTISEFGVHKLNINSHKELLSYDSAVKKTVNAYHLVFDGFKSEVVDKLNNVQNSSELAAYTAEQIGSDSNKLSAVVGLSIKQHYTNERKQFFLQLLKKTEKNIDSMLKDVQDSATALLRAEYELIDK